MKILGCRRYPRFCMLIGWTLVLVTARLLPENRASTETGAMDDAQAIAVNRQRRWILQEPDTPQPSTEASPPHTFADLMTRNRDDVISTDVITTESFAVQERTGDESTTSTHAGKKTSTQEETITSTHTGTATIIDEDTAPKNESRPATTRQLSPITTPKNESRAAATRELSADTLPKNESSLACTEEEDTTTGECEKQSVTSIDSGSEVNNTVEGEKQSTDSDSEVNSNVQDEEQSLASTNSSSEHSSTVEDEEQSLASTESSSEETTTLNVLENDPLGEPGSVSMETVRTSMLVIPVLSILVSVVGILLNIPSLLVFRRMGSSVSNGYIQILLSLDTVCLLFNLPQVVVEVFYRDVLYLPLGYAYYKTYCGMVVIIATRNVLMPLTALMTLDRTLSVVFPLTKGRVTSVLSHPRAVAGVVTLLAYAVNFVDGGFRNEVVEYVDEKTGVVYGLIRQTPLFRNNMKEYMQVYLGVNTIFQHIPLALIIASNIALLVSLVRHDHFMQQTMDNNANSSVRRANTIRSVKVVLLYSFVFMILALPITLLHIVDIARPDLKQAQRNLHLIFMTMLPFLDTLSSAADFFVFFAVNSVFREGFRHLLCTRSPLRSRWEGRQRPA